MFAQILFISPLSYFFLSSVTYSKSSFLVGSMENSFHGINDSKCSTRIRVKRIICLEYMNYLVTLVNNLNDVLNVFMLESKDLTKIVSKLLA